MHNPKDEYCCCNTSCCRKNKTKNNKCRRTIRNIEKTDHWNARNSSVQMNAILTPDLYEELAKSECSCDLEIHPDEVTKTKSKIKWLSGNKKVTSSRYHTKCFTKKPPKPKLKKTVKRNVIPSASCECGSKTQRTKFKNECYCTYPLEKPLLLTKPPISFPNCKITRKFGMKSPELESESNHTLQTLRKAKELLHEYSPESVFLKRLQNECRKLDNCQCNICENNDLKYTDRRKYLEEAYKNVEKNSMDEIARKYHGCEINSCCSFGKNNQNFVVLPSCCVDCEKIDAVKQIRNENYFDTHSTEDLIKKKIPDHKCVHKFTLDERLLPKPLNADNFGISRCVICNKALDSDANAEKTRLGCNARKENTNNFATSHRKICFPGKNDLIELKVPPVLISNQKNLKISKMMAPSNSWALRYQKGVI